MCTNVQFKHVSIYFLFTFTVTLKVEFAYVNMHSFYSLFLQVIRVHV